MSMIKKQFARLYQLFTNKTYCAHRLTLSASLGIFIAFSPFIGLHTIMVFFFAWLFSLPTAVLLAVSMGINNPWTMFPIYGSGHWFGMLLCDSFAIDHTALVPLCLQSWNKWLFSFFGDYNFSLGAFLVGGNMLGCLCAIISYPIIKYGLITYIRSKKYNAMEKK